MLKQLLTRGLVACLLAVGLQSASAQTFWTENFNNQASATSNWVHGGTNGGTNTWAWSNDPAAGNWQPGNFSAPTAGQGYMWFDSDGNGEFDHDVTLTGVGVPANCTGKNDVHLRFNTYFRTFDASDDVSVGVSTNGTNFTYYTFAQLEALEGDAGIGVYNGVLDLDLPQADNQAQVWIQFKYVGFFQYYWKVDDLQLYDGAPTVPSHNVTFKVNMATQPSVDPGGVRIAGSFTNWADEVMTDEGNGVWSITKSLPEGSSHQYKFKNGPNGWESGQAGCGVSDGFGGYNRTFTTGTTDVTLLAVCFNSCGPCSGLPCNLNPDAIICDNFDTYNPALKLGPQATHWTTWSGTEGTNEDGIVTTEQASSPANSLKIVSTAAGGGPQDVLLNLGNKATGNYSLKWKMYVPVGKQGYYNFQNVVPLVGGNGDWALDVYFGANGNGFAVRAGASGLDTFFHFTYTHGAWFDVEHKIDVDNNTIAMSVNGNQAGKTSYTKNLGGIDFFGANNFNQYYIDDVEYIKLPDAAFNADSCDLAQDITGLFGAPEGTIVTSPVFDNANATTSAADPTEGLDCFFATDGLQVSNYYTFTGDGGTYNITSKDCGNNPIGDTQFALYKGECGSFTPLGCDDDGAPGNANLYSSLDLTTEEGVTYYLIVDGWYDAANDVQYSGTFCLDVVRGELISCADAQLGTIDVGNNGIVCWNGTLSDVLGIDAASFTIPTQGPAGGLSWCWTEAPLQSDVWPGVPSGLVSVSPPLVKDLNTFTFDLPNDGSLTFAQPGTYYLTPVLVAGATLSNAQGSTQMWNLLEPGAGGCYFVGESIPITFVPEVEPIAAFSTTTANGNNVDIELTVAGGYPGAVGDPNIADYIYEWDPNVSDNAFATDVPNVPYTVIISDPTGCTDPLVLDIAVGTTDPASVQSFTITPNPTAGMVNVNISLEKSADIRIDVVNTLGQTMQTIKVGQTAQVNQPVNLAGLASGTYTIHVRMDNETAVRRVVLQK